MIPQQYPSQQQQFIFQFKPIINTQTPSMSRHTETLRKHDLQKSQIRSILSDFRKTKHKCLALHEELGSEFVRKAELQAVEKEVVLKVDLLDLGGLVLLKNKLVLCLSEMFDVQAELNTQRERIAARKEFNKFMKPTERPPDPRPKQSKNNTTNPQPPRPIPDPIPPSQPLSSTQPQTHPQPQTSAYNIPVYHLTNDSPENKVQRITKYVAALKSNDSKEVGNMKMHAQESGGHAREIFREDPEYLEMKREVERLRKDKEDLQGRLRTVADRAIDDFISKAEVVEETDAYKIIKIYRRPTANPKPAPTPEPTPKPLPIPPPASQPQPQPQPQSEPQPSTGPPRRLKITNLQQEIESIRQKRRDAQIVEIEKQLQKQQYNVEAVVSRISSTLENNQDRLRRLREQRMKIFEKQQDIWSELEQL